MESKVKSIKGSCWFQWNPLKPCGYQWNPEDLWNPVAFTTILLEFMKSFEISWNPVSFSKIVLNFMKSNEIHSILHEIHLKPVRTTESSEIIHFLLVFHMESSGFHMKSIKSTNEIHNVIHIETFSKSKWNLYYLKSSWSPPDLNWILLDFINT